MKAQETGKIKAELEGVSAETAAELFQPWINARGILLAVSGGPDSMALLHLASIWAKTHCGPALHAATVDHGLRSGAQAEAELAAESAAKLNIPHDILRWEGEKPASAIQEKARHARYDLLFAHARDIGADVLMTAHHADDQAETILFRLLRGSGLAGLAGMKSSSRRDGFTLARPLLGLRKTALVAFCRAAGQPFAEDPSNADSRYARTRLRAHLAGLENLGLGAPDWTRLAHRLARADEALALAAQQAARRVTLPEANGSGAINFRMLAEEPEETGLRVLAQAMQQAGATRPQRLEKLESLYENLATASKQRSFYAATLGGLKLSLDDRGMLTFKIEGPRMRVKKS